MSTSKIWNREYTVLFLVNLIVSTSFYMVSTALSKHLVGLGMTVTVTGSIVGVMSFASMLTRPVSGWISDRLNQKWLLSGALAVNFVCVLGYGAAATVAVFIFLRILHGIAFGLVTTVTMVLVSSFIPVGRMGEGMGYFGLAQTLAVAIGPSISLALYDAVGGQNMFLAAALCVAVSFMSAQFMRYTPEKGVSRKSNAFRFRFRDLIAKEALIYAVITMALSSVNGIENSYIALYAEQVGIRNAGWYFTVSAAALLVSRTACSRLTDRFGFKRVLWMGLGCTAAALAVLSVASAEWAVPVFAAGSVLKALGVGMLQPALQAATIQSVTTDRRGAATSTFYVGTDLGQFAAPAAAGKMVDLAGYPFAFRAFIFPLIAVGIAYMVFQSIKGKIKSV